jgi:hypothetical protein
LISTLLTFIACNNIGGPNTGNSNSNVHYKTEGCWVECEYTSGGIYKPKYVSGIYYASNSYYAYNIDEILNDSVYIGWIDKLTNGNFKWYLDYTSDQNLTPNGNPNFVEIGDYQIKFNYSSSGYSLGSEIWEFAFGIDTAIVNMKYTSADNTYYYSSFPMYLQKISGYANKSKLP